MYDYEGVLITSKVTLLKDYNNNKQFNIILLVCTCECHRTSLGHYHLRGQLMSEFVVEWRTVQYDTKLEVDGPRECTERPRYRVMGVEKRCN